jgi:hypothetical protein
MVMERNIGEKKNLSSEDPHTGKRGQFSPKLEDTWPAHHY